VTRLEIGLLVGLIVVTLLLLWAIHRAGTERIGRQRAETIARALDKLLGLAPAKRAKVLRAGDELRRKARARKAAGDEPRQGAPA